MKKDILQKGIILPLIIGIVLAVAFFIFLRGTNVFQPLADNTIVAYHDDVNASAEMVSVDNINKCKINDNIGTLSAVDNSIGTLTSADDSYMVRYKADFANMISSVSFVDGVAFGDGVAFLEVTSEIGERIVSFGDVTYNGTFGEHKYTYVASKEYDGKYKLMSEASNLMDENNGFILIYQEKENGGLSSKYVALVYEEVA